MPYPFYLHSLNLSSIPCLEQGPFHKIALSHLLLPDCFFIIIIKLFLIALQSSQHPWMIIYPAISNSSYILIKYSSEMDICLPSFYLRECMIFSLRSLLKYFKNICFVRPNSHYSTLSISLFNTHLMASSTSEERFKPLKVLERSLPDNGSRNLR